MEQSIIKLEPLNRVNETYVVDIEKTYTAISLSHVYSEMLHNYVPVIVFNISVSQVESIFGRMPDRRYFIIPDTEQILHDRSAKIIALECYKVRVNNNFGPKISIKGRSAFLYKHRLH